MRLPKTMRGAMLLGPEKIDVCDVSVPRPGPGEILLKIVCMKVGNTAPEYYNMHAVVRTKRTIMTWMCGVPTGTHLCSRPHLNLAECQWHFEIP